MKDCTVCWGSLPAIKCASGGVQTKDGILLLKEPPMVLEVGLISCLGPMDSDRFSRKTVIWVGLAVLRESTSGVE